MNLIEKLRPWLRIEEKKKVVGGRISKRLWLDARANAKKTPQALRHRQDWQSCTFAELDQALDLCSSSAELIILAPSLRVLAWMIKRGRIPPSSMALTVVEAPPIEPEVLEPPPARAITPCDPWPRPYYLEDGLRRVRKD